MMKPECPTCTLEVAEIPRWIAKHARLTLNKRPRIGSIYDRLAADVFKMLLSGQCVRMVFGSNYEAGVTRASLSRLLRGHDVTVLADGCEVVALYREDVEAALDARPGKVYGPVMFHG